MGLGADLRGVLGDDGVAQRLAFGREGGVAHEVGDASALFEDAQGVADPYRLRVGVGEDAARVVALADLLVVVAGLFVALGELLEQVAVGTVGGGGVRAAQVGHGGEACLDAAQGVGLFPVSVMVRHPGPNVRTAAMVVFLSITWG